MHDSPSRPVVRKSSPAPLARALENEVPIRALSPLRRAAGSLAVAAAMVLAAGGAAALAGCGDADRSGRTGRDRSSREDRTDRRETAEKRASDSPLDDLVNAVGDFVNPPTTPADQRRTPTPPASDAPRPAGTTSPTLPTSSPPRPAGSAASPPIPRSVVAS